MVRNQKTLANENYEINVKSDKWPSFPNYLYKQIENLDKKKAYNKMIYLQN